MKKAVKTAALALLCVLMLTLTACGSDLSGKWHSTSEKATQLVFSSTGRVTMSADGITLSGAYTVEENRLTMVLQAPDGETYTIYATYWISDKNLYLQNDKGQTEIFQR